MKKIRIVLIVLGAAATILLGVNRLGDSPLSKGYDTGFNATVWSSPAPVLGLTADGGNLNCWVQLKLPKTSHGFSAKLSSGTSLSVYEISEDGSFQWIAIVAEGQKREEQFKWPAGTTIFVNGDDNNPSSLSVADWKVFLGDKGFDSQQRAAWRKNLFHLSILLVLLAVAAGVLEAYARLNPTVVPLTAQRCIEELIKTTEGASSKETAWMQKILSKVVIENATVNSVLDTLPLKNLERWTFWFKTRDQFRSKLNGLIVNLDFYLGRLNNP